MHQTTTFVPFLHESQDSKNNLINFARSQDTSDVKGVFTATLIYTNLVDYLARHLLDNLRTMMSEFTHRHFGAVVYYDPSHARKNIPLGETCKELKLFTFPDKDEFIKLLSEFNQVRIRIVHNLMQVDFNQDGTDFDNDLKSIKTLAEEILTRYNRIVNGVTIAWNAATSTAPQASPQQTTSTS